MRLSKISMAGLRSKYVVRDYRGEHVPDALPGDKPFIWAEIEQAARPSKVPWEEFKLQQLEKFIVFSALCFCFSCCLLLL